YPDGYFSDKKYVNERFCGTKSIPSFAVLDINRIDSFVDKLHDAKVPSLLAGFVRLSTHAINRMSQATDVNLREFFRSEIMKGPGDKHYSDSEIAFYYKVIQESCAKKGINFNTCYIGNGIKDYFQYQE